MDIILRNKGILSLIDMTTMGDSVKREDDSKIGQFDSGLKYAIAILFRNGIKMDIHSDNSIYTFSSKTHKDDLTNKVKELLVINREISGGTTEHLTSFSPNLGFEWKVWMAIRELYSNCLDEKGSVQFTDEYDVGDSEGETVVIIHDNGLLTSMIDSWNMYFLDVKRNPIYEKSGIRIFPNEGDHLCIYKNNILIHEDNNVKSRYVYDYKNASIDEMRVLNDLGAVKDTISSRINSCTDLSFIEDFLKAKSDKNFESGLDYFYGLSKTWKETINKKHKDGDLYLYPKLRKSISELEGVDIGYKRVSYNSPSYSYCKVEVEEVEEKEPSFEDKVASICSPFEIPYKIEQSKISRFTCIPNIREKIIYVSEEFSKENVWEMVKAVCRIEGDDDVDHVFHKYVELLNK